MAGVIRRCPIKTDPIKTAVDYKAGTVWQVDRRRTTSRQLMEIWGSHSGQHRQTKLVMRYFDLNLFLLVAVMIDKQEHFD